MKWLCALLSAILLAACTRTESWKEDVLLASGQTTTILRSETRGPDAFFRPGAGSPMASEIVGDIPPFGRVRYTHKSRSYPLLFDHVDGKLWLVAPVMAGTDCEKLGYPIESVVVKGYSNGSWTRVPFGDAPQQLKVNLAQSSQLWFGGHDGTGQKLPAPHVTVASKRAYGKHHGYWPDNEMPLTEASLLLRGLGQSCADQRSKLPIQPTR